MAGRVVAYAGIQIFQARENTSSLYSTAEMSSGEISSWRTMTQRQRPPANSTSRSNIQSCQGLPPSQ